MDIFILGAVAMASLVAALFFMKFYHQTHDLLFLMFSVSFLVETVNRTALGMMRVEGEGHPSLYLIRLVSYLLILAGIVVKNVKKT